MPVETRWVVINGETMLSITLPQRQHVLIDRDTGWKLLLSLRSAMRENPDGRQLPGHPG